jgi:hypothetical protein
MGRTKPGTDPTLHLKAETSWIRLPTAPPLCDGGLTTATQGLLLLLHLNLIQRLIHRQLPQHHDLRNSQQGPAV